MTTMTATPPATTDEIGKGIRHQVDLIDEQIEALQKKREGFVQSYELVTGKPLPKYTKNDYGEHKTSDMVIKAVQSSGPFTQSRDDIQANIKAMFGFDVPMPTISSRLSELVKDGSLVREVRDSVRKYAAPAPATETPEVDGKGFGPRVVS